MADLPINVTVSTGTPITVTVGTQVARITFLDEDEKLRFDGIAGDSYLIYNSTLSRMEMWVDNVLKAAWG